MNRNSRKIRVWVLSDKGLFVFLIRIANKIKKHPLATNEAIDGALPPRSAAASGRLVLLVSDRRLSLLGCLGRAGAAPKLHATNSDADTAIELLSEVVTWSVLVWFGRQTGMKNWVCDSLEFFEAPWAVYSVAAPVALPLEIDGSRL